MYAGTRQLIAMDVTVTDENAVRHEMLEVLERCVEGSAPIFSYIDFESAYALDNALSEELLGQLGRLALLAHEFCMELRGPEDFLDEARDVLAASRSGVAAAGG